MEVQEKIVYFVRHGQSVDNAAPVFHSLDSPLSELGKKQAEKIAERISRIDFETLIASPLPRARETAHAVVKLTNKIPEYSDLFVERKKPTNLYGKSLEDEEAGLLGKKWKESLYTPGLRVEDGENFDDLVARADQALEFLASRPEKRLVVVTHGNFLRAMVVRVILAGSLTPEAFKNFYSNTQMENTGLTVLRYDKTNRSSGWQLWIYNDHAHLG